MVLLLLLLLLLLCGGGAARARRRGAPPRPLRGAHAAGPLALTTALRGSRCAGSHGRTSSPAGRRSSGVPSSLYMVRIRSGIFSRCGLTSSDSDFRSSGRPHSASRPPLGWCSRPSSGTWKEAVIARIGVSSCSARTCTAEKERPFVSSLVSKWMGSLVSPPRRKWQPKWCTERPGPAACCAAANPCAMVCPPYTRPQPKLTEWPR